MCIIFRLNFRSAWVSLTEQAQFEWQMQAKDQQIQDLQARLLRIEEEDARIKARPALKHGWFIVLNHLQVFGIFSQTVLALRGSYSVAFREGPGRGWRCRDAVGQHFPLSLQYKTNGTLKNSYILEEINVRRCCRPAFSLHY